MYSAYIHKQSFKQFLTFSWVVPQDFQKNNQHGYPELIQCFSSLYPKQLLSRSLTSHLTLYRSFRGRDYPKQEFGLFSCFADPAHMTDRRLSSIAIVHMLCICSLKDFENSRRSVQYVTICLAYVWSVNTVNTCKLTFVEYRS